DLISENDWSKLRDTIEFQRPLKPQERGRCRFYVEEFRAHKSLPSSQKFRIEQDLANLKWIDTEKRSHFLTPTQRQALRNTLNIKQSFSFSSVLKMKSSNKERLFPDAIAFNLATEAKEKLVGNEPLIALTKALGLDLPQDPQKLDDLASTLLEAPDNKDLAVQLQEQGFSAEQIETLTYVSLKPGTMSLSTKAMTQLTDAMQQGMLYSDAVRELENENEQAFHHSVKTIDEKQLGLALPYYGKILVSSVVGGRPDEVDPQAEPEVFYGRIGNPTVHLALNQLRKLVNFLIKKHGPPSQIALELAREIKQSQDQRKETLKIQAKNQKENERLKNWAAKELNMHRLSRTDLQKLKLWEELGENATVRRCVFTGRVISASQVLGPEIEIEHILPFSRTLDDRMSNKTLAYKAANNLKGNQDPFSAFGSDQHAHKEGGDYAWSNMLARAQNLPPFKSWRFAPDAMERYKGENNGFIERSLNDTRYLSRIAREYLSHLVGVGNIWVVTGQLTASLRHEWGLNRLLSDGPGKDRSDNRHHLVDAFVVGMTTRSLLQKLAKESRYTSDHKLDKFVPELGSIQTDLESLLERVVVSYKPDHGVNGQFFNETAYGISEPPEDMENERKFTTRVSVENLKAKPESFGVSNLKGICDPAIQHELKEHLREGSERAEKEKETLKHFMHHVLPGLVEKRGIKRLRVRILNSSVDPIPSAPFKGYAVGGYGFCDVWRIPQKNGKPPKHEGVFVPLHQANQAEKGKFDPNNLKPHPAAKRMMRLFKDDMVSYQDEGKTKICKVYGFSASDNRLDVRENVAPGTSKLYVSINVLGAKKLKKVHVLPDGSIRGGNL
ncbi:MAG: type II CRISPR RNA-guided endonuclease Cas9, partial [Alphaproteobacteria bacterium]